MTRVVDTYDVDAAELAAFLRPRDDLVAEEAVGDGVFELAEGPFDTYRRTIEVEPGPSGTNRITQTTDFELAIPVMLWCSATQCR